MKKIFLVIIFSLIILLSGCVVKKDGIYQGIIKGMYPENFQIDLDDFSFGYWYNLNTNYMTLEAIDKINELKLEENDIVQITIKDEIITDIKFIKK